MALCFLGKQIDHAKSVIILTTSRDVILVARSMIEGLCQLLWAAREPKTLPLRWRAFVWVHDWRLMRAKEMAGDAVDSQRRAEIENSRHRFGDQFIKDKAKARSHSKSPHEDPYYKDWRSGRTIRQICTSVGAEDLYELVYEPFSDWHHWGPAGLGSAIHRRERRVIYSSLLPSDAGVALAVAFQCLLQTAEVVLEHLSLGGRAELRDLRDRYLEWHKETLGTPGIGGWADPPAV